MADLSINTFQCHDNLWHLANKFSLTYTFLLATKWSLTRSCVLDSIIYFVPHNMPKCIKIYTHICIPIVATGMQDFTHTHTHTQRLWGRASFICSVPTYTISLYILTVCVCCS